MGGHWDHQPSPGHSGRQTTPRNLLPGSQNDPMLFFMLFGETGSDGAEKGTNVGHKNENKHDRMQV